MNPRDSKEESEFLISQYLDGTLSDEDRNAFEARLGGDAELQKLLGDYRTVNAAVHDWGAMVPELDWTAFEAKARHRRLALETPSPRRPLIYKFLVPMSAAAAILLLVTIWRSQSPTVGPSFVGTDPSVEAVVVVARPETASMAADAFVSYSYSATTFESEAIGDTENRPAVAKAAVGKHVRWPTLGESTSAF